MRKNYNFVFEITYFEAGKKVKQSGEMLGKWADDVILALLNNYPNCTGTVKIKGKLRD